MRVKIKKLDTIANHKYARCDCKFWKIKERIPFNNFVRLKELFHIISGSVQTENYSDVITSIPYIRISDIDYKFGISKNNIIYLSEDSKIADNKILKENDLVLATIGTVGKIGMAGDCVGGTHSNNTVILRPKTDEINVKFYEKLFQSDFYIKYIFGIAAQKAQPNLQDYEIKNILLPVINKTIIEQAVKNFEPIENEIQSFKLTIKPTQTIIDEVFKKEFHFDYHRFEELKKISRFDTAIADFSNNPDLRFSAKFHRSAGEFVKQELAKITDKKIKHFLAEPIVLGASVSPSDYDENGGYHYLSMATIKDWNYNKEEAQLVSNVYALSKEDKKIRKNDLILARSGEGTIGKVALIEDEDVKAVFADFTMRIRLQNYNFKFAYYFMRSMYFQYLIEIYKKGLGNNTNIFPVVIKEFPLPDISLTEQDRIVNEIQSEIDKQTEIKNKITDLRNKIDDIIEKTIQE